MKKILSVGLLAFAGITFAAPPVLINGRPAGKGEYPEVVYLTFDKGRCSGTLVGPQSILTAAHCGDNGSKARFQVGQTQYESVCTRAPIYPSKDLDLMLCKVSKPVSVKYASIGGQAKKGNKISLAGYGCVKAGGGGGNDGVLRVGDNTVTNFQAYDFVSTQPNGAALCFGDSGGPAFVYLADAYSEHHYQLGVNSKGDIKTTNYNTRTDHPESQAFFRDWAEKNGAQICGLNVKCDGNSEPQPPPPSDCLAHLEQVEKQQEKMDGYIRNLRQCLEK